MSYRAVGQDVPSQRLVGQESTAIERVGEEKYARIVELQRRLLSRTRLDWRFWAGLSMAVTGAAFLYWRPDLRAAGGRARGRLRKVAEPVVERVT